MTKKKQSSPEKHPEYFLAVDIGDPDKQEIHCLVFVQLFKDDAIIAVEYITIKTTDSDTQKAILSAIAERYNARQLIAERGVF